jgi:starch synthase
MSKTRVLFAASEVYPFAKSGGLADVAYALPRALSHDTDITVVMPLYGFIDKARFGIEPTGESFDVTMAQREYRVALHTCRIDGVNYLFVDSLVLCDRSFLYGPPEQGYEDNAIRFGIFAHAIIALLYRGSYDLVHLNDWQCGLVPLLIDQDPSLHLPSLFTIHNLAYQGTFDQGFIEALGVDRRYFTMDGIEYYGQMSFMKAGIAYADAVTTVSPNYAKEILATEFGCGLEGFLTHHRHKLHGVLNGVDYEHFSPADDDALAHPYADVKGKRPNKKAFLSSIGLKGIDLPLFIFIGRFTWQKGLDLLIDALPALAAKPCNIAILGEGESHYHERLQAIADKHANIDLRFGYDEGLSHRMYAAADFLMMPSLFEPCGLNQMISMRYGTMPIVHHVGGLADTVHPFERFDTSKAQGMGITFASPTRRSFVTALGKAVKLYDQKRQFNKVSAHNMAQDFSWDESAQHYIGLYKQVTEKP